MGATRLVGQGQGGTCAMCGAQLEADAMFCIVCGNPVTQSGEVASGAANLAGPPQATCAQCGSPLDEGARFCIACGAQVPSAGGQMSAPTRSCPNCGWELDPDALYCISCGAQVPQVASSPAGPEIGVPGATGTARIDNNIPQQPHQAPQQYQAPPQPQPMQVPGAPVTLVPVRPSQDDDDDATARPRLIMLTREEARTGCTKTLRLDPTTTIEVDVPAGVDVNTKMDAPGYGHFDELTGQRGPLRLSFFVD